MPPTIAAWPTFGVTAPKRRAVFPASDHYPPGTLPIGPIKGRSNHAWG